MPQLSLKCNDLKGHFRVQTETIQAWLFGEVNVPRVVYPHQSLAGRCLFHFCREFLQVSWAKLLPAKTQSSSSGWLQPDHQVHLAEPDGGKAKHRTSGKQKHPSTARDGFWFRSCKNTFHEPVNQHDSMMPSARSINDCALQVVCVFPFRSCHRGIQCLPGRSTGSTQMQRCISHEGRNFPQACCKIKSLEARAVSDSWCSAADKKSHPHKSLCFEKNSFKFGVIYNKYLSINLTQWVLQPFQVREEGLSPAGWRCPIWWCPLCCAKTLGCLTSKLTAFTLVRNTDTLHAPRAGGDKPKPEVSELHLVKGWRSLRGYVSLVCSCFYEESRSVDWRRNWAQRSPNFTLSHLGEVAGMQGWVPVTPCSPCTPSCRGQCWSLCLVLALAQGSAALGTYLTCTLFIFALLHK